MKFEAEGRELAKNFETTRSIFSNSKRSEKNLKQKASLAHSWRFLRSGTLEQLQFKLGEKMGFRNLQEKLANSHLYSGHEVYWGLQLVLHIY